MGERQCFNTSIIIINIINLYNNNGTGVLMGYGVSNDIHLNMKA